MNQPALLGLFLRRFTLRHWRDAPGQILVLNLILALGIAVYFAVRLANRAAVASFEHFTGLVTAESDWIIHAPAGDLPEPVLAELRNALGAEPVHLLPVIESTATAPPATGDESIGNRATFRLIGLDLVALQNLARARGDSQSWFASTPGTDSDVGVPDDRRFWNILAHPRTAFVSDALARKDGLAAGDTLDLVINEQVVRLEVAGVVPAAPGRPAVPAELLVMDLPALQRLTGREGWLTRIEFVVPEGAGLRDRRNHVREVLDRGSGPGVDGTPGTGRWLVTSPSERREAGAMMTRAFRLNLTILSLMALLVGLYLVLQALDGAVVRRRAEIGVLRSLGVEEATIRNAWLVEAAALGVVGGCLGATFGWAGAQLAVRLVGRTVNALYYATTAESAVLTAGEWLGAVGLAVGASLLAGWWPARQAALTPAAQLLQRPSGSVPPSRARNHRAWGVGLLLAGLAFALAPPLHLPGGARFPLGGYGAAFLWIAAGGFLGGAALAVLARLIQPVGRRFLAARLAASQLTRPSSHHRLATAGLVSAVAMTAGMIILVGSFDRTMRGWIARTFQSDLYISSAGAQSASTDNRISPATWRGLVSDPSVLEANVLHAGEINLPEGRTILAAGDFGFMQRHVDLAWVEAPQGDDLRWARSDPGDDKPVPALASESFAERFQRRRGARIILPTPSGPRALRLAGIFADYGNERGSLIVDRRYFTNWFRLDQASSVILKLRDPADAEAFRARWIAAQPGLQIFTNAHLRGEVMRIFRQTFGITYALEAIGLTVAILGLAMALSSVLLERRAELTTLRALGFRHQEMARAAALEGWLVALAGLAVGLAVSLALGWLLIHVINKQTFGWTLEFVVPVPPLALLVLLVAGVGAGVSYAMGRWGAGLPAEREE